MNKTAALSPSDLEEILTLEYQAFLDGDLRKIEQLGRYKSEVLEKVSKLPPDQFENFISLRENLKRNQELANCVIRGTRRALVRVQEILDLKSKFGTYNAMGEKSLHSVGSGRLMSKRS